MISCYRKITKVHFKTLQVHWLSENVEDAETWHPNSKGRDLYMSYNYWGFAMNDGGFKCGKKLK